MSAATWPTFWRSMPVMVRCVCLGSIGHFDAGGQRKLDRVRKAEGKHDRVLALQLGAVADADDVEFLGPALGDSVTALKTSARASPWNAAVLVVLAFSVQRCRLCTQGDAAGKHGRDLALGAFDEHRVAILADLVLDAGWAAELASCRYVTLLQSF
jgi:hypothetical protein